MDIVAQALIAYLASCAWHEFGHCLGAWLCGLRVEQVLVAPLWLRRERAGWRLGWVNAIGVNFVVPSAESLARGRRAAWSVVAGGPCASAVAMVCCALAQPYGIAGARVGMLMSAVLLVTSLWPGVRRGTLSDGLRLWRLWRDSGERERAARSLAANRLAASDGRPRHWDFCLVRELSYAHGCDPDDLAALEFAYFGLLDRGLYDDADMVLERMLRIAPAAEPCARRRVFLEAAWFQAFHGRDAVSARRFLSSALKTPGMDPEADRVLSRRARAAITWLEGERTVAAELAARALEGFVPRTGIDTMREESLQRLTKVAAWASAR